MHSVCFGPNRFVIAFFIALLLIQTICVHSLQSYAECSAELVALPVVAVDEGTPIDKIVFETDNSQSTYLKCQNSMSGNTLSFVVDRGTLSENLLFCARACVASLQGSLNYYWSFMTNRCYCHMDPLDNLSYQTPTLGNCTAFRTFVTTFECLPSPSTSGACTYGCVTHESCCVKKGDPTSEPIRAEYIVIPTVVIAALFGVGVGLMVYRHRQRAKLLVDGEEGRQRLHRHGHCRDEAEAGSIADTILRPLVLPHREFQKSCKANADPFRGLDLSRSSSVGSFDDGNECPACHETLLGSARTVTLRCHHQLHLSCIKGHIQHQLMNYEAISCPMCHTAILESPSHGSLTEGNKGSIRRKKDAFRSEDSLDSLDEELETGGARKRSSQRRPSVPQLLHSHKKYNNNPNTSAIVDASHPLMDSFDE